MIAEIRVLLTRCAKEIKSLRDKFTNDLFDQNLNHVENIAISLSREFTYDDVSSLLTSLFAVVEHVEKVKEPVQRNNRLMRLEAMLQAVVNTTNIPISNRRRAMAQEYLTNCQKSLNQIQIHPSGTEESNVSSAKETHMSEHEPKKTHAAVALQAKRVKHESSVAPKQHYHPAAAQPPTTKKKDTLTMGVHVRF